MFRRIRKCFRVTGIFERRHEHKQGGSLSPRIVISTADHLRQCLDLFFAYIAGLGYVREVHIDDAFARIGADVRVQQTTDRLFPNRNESRPGSVRRSIYCL